MPAHGALRELELPFLSAGAPSSKLVRQDRSGLLVDQIQRERVKLFARGDRVEVFSDTAQEWMLDGEVVEVVKERCTRDGLHLRAGSTKVVYGNGRRYKWLSPCMLDDMLRTLPLPRFPEALSGEMAMKTAAGWFCSPQEHVYVELYKGYLQWWKAEEDAKLGQSAAGSLHLRDSAVTEHGLCLNLQIDGSMGAVCMLEATTSADASKWAAALKQHADFCQAESKNLSKNLNDPLACDVIL